MGAVTRVDFAVPTHYTIGPRFPTWEAAVNAARALIETTRYKGQGGSRTVVVDDPKRRRVDGDDLLVDTRAFVDMREVDSESDSVVRRWEVFLDGTTEVTA